MRSIDSYAADLAPGLTDPDYMLPAGLADTSEEARQRYNIYRNNVTVSLINAVAAVYPATLRITGECFFRAMARQYIQIAPPRSPLLFQYGHTFPDFIADYEFAQEMSWLPDTARIERAWLDAYHAADLPTLPAAVLGDVPAARLSDVVMTPHPAARIVRSHYPAVSVFVMNRGDGPVRPIENIRPEDALITRPEEDVVVRILPPGGAVFLSRLIAGSTLSEAAETALETAADFDLTSNIAGMLEAGVFTALYIGAKR